MAAASRLIGMRRGCRTIRRKKANSTRASTATENASIVDARIPPPVAPRSPAQENDGKSPWRIVSAEPMVMTMKPQKIRKWYLLPSALTNLGQRLAGMVVFSTTFFCAKK